MMHACSTSLSFSLTLARKLHGLDSMKYGLILLELIEHYERMGQEKEAERLWGQIRDLFTRRGHEMNLSVPDA